MPDVLLIDVPTRFAGHGLALDSYYPVVLETLAEMHDFETFLCAERDGPVSPNLLDHRPLRLQTDDIVFARYAPPTAVWPWLLLCRWPPLYTAFVPSQDEHFARGAYTIEAFRSFPDMASAERRLLDVLGAYEVQHVGFTSVSGTA